MAGQAENLREACCIGDYEAVRGLLSTCTDVNAQNAVNGWTALHWAVYRGHTRVASLLLSQGADTSVCNKKGETPIDVAKSDKMRKLLLGRVAMESSASDEISAESPQQTDLPFQPSYLKYPQLTFVPPVKKSEGFPSEANTPRQDSELPVGESPQTIRSNPVVRQPQRLQNTGELVTVKVRLAKPGEEDFVEIDLHNRSFEDLQKTCAEELDIELADISKVRKLPNVLVRKDRDVERLRAGDELEVVLQS